MQHIDALGQLCELLSVSTEESLSMLPVESLAPLLVSHLCLAWLYLLLILLAETARCLFWIQLAQAAEERQPALAASTAGRPPQPFLQKAAEDASHLCPLTTEGHSACMCSAQHAAGQSRLLRARTPWLLACPWSMPLGPVLSPCPSSQRGLLVNSHADSTIML